MKIVVTHNGKFHADDVLGYAILLLALKDEEFRLIRTRNRGIIAQADIVFDVGGSYEPKQGLFDHHMANGPMREDRVPYSAAGLLWQHFGRQAVRAMFDHAVPDELVEGIWGVFDRGVILDTDLHDNGVPFYQGHSVEGGFLPSLVNDFRPPWNVEEGEKPDLEDKGFTDAAYMVKGLLIRRAQHLEASWQARKIVREAIERAHDPRWLELPGGMPWQTTVFDMKLDDLLYVVHPGNNNDWRLVCVPPSYGKFGQRKPLPVAWSLAGDEGFAQVSGVEDAIFAHHGRFLAGAKTREGIMRLLQIALDAPIDNTVCF